MDVRSIKSPPVKHVVAVGGNRGINLSHHSAARVAAEVPVGPGPRTGSLDSDGFTETQSLPSRKENAD